MTDATLFAGTLTASRDDRLVSGMLLPYGEQGRTNLGKFTVPPGKVTMPTDLSTVLANLDHQRENPVATARTLTETPAGIVASWRVADGPEGDTLLAEVADTNNPNARRALSVELADVVLRAGQLVSGRLFGGAFVKAGAFPSATLLAADVGEDDPEDPADEDDPEAVVTTSTDVSETTDEFGTYKTTRDVTTVTAGSKTTTTTVETVEETEPEDPAEEDVTDVPNASKPTTLTARRAAQPAATPNALSFAQVMRGLNDLREGRASSTLLASLRDSGGAGPSTVFAALNDITFDKTATSPGKVINPFPQWIGELWDGLVFERDVVDVFGTPKALTSNKIAGWRWKVKPKGDTWLGNKTAVPSNTPEAVGYESSAAYFAGAHDHANEYRHFPNAEYWTSYYEAMRESYAYWSNEQAWNLLREDATPLVADVVPDGLAAGLSMLIDGAVAVVEANALPSFAFLEPRLWKQMLKTQNLDVLGYLNASLGFKAGTLEDGGFTLRPRVGQTGVLVGAREAFTPYELPGVPLRIEAEDLTKGGLDTGLFGYFGAVTHKADAIVQVNSSAA